MPRQRRTGVIECRHSSIPMPFRRRCELQRAEAHLTSPERREIRFCGAATEVHLKVVGREIGWFRRQYSRHSSMPDPDEFALTKRSPSLEGTKRRSGIPGTRFLPVKEGR